MHLMDKTYFQKSQMCCKVMGARLRHSKRVAASLHRMQCCVKLQFMIGSASSILDYCVLPTVVGEVLVKVFSWSSKSSFFSTWLLLAQQHDLCLFLKVAALPESEHLRPSNPSIEDQLKKSH